MFPLFTRTVPHNIAFVPTVKAILNYYKWKKVGVLSGYRKGDMHLNSDIARNIRRMLVKYLQKDDEFEVKVDADFTPGMNNRDYDTLFKDLVSKVRGKYYFEKREVMILFYYRKTCLKDTQSQ